MSAILLSAFLEVLPSILLSYIKEEVKLVTGVNDEIKKLVSNFKSIEALLDDAEEQQLKDASVKNWLSNLKVVSYDMDDVLDEWTTWIQLSQHKRQHPFCSFFQYYLKHKVPYIFRRICFTGRDVDFRQKVDRKLKEIQQRLGDIAAEKVMDQLTSSQKIEKHIEIDIPKVKGGDEEKDEVKSTGLGRIGKTTLAQLVLNDDEIQTHFEKKIWGCALEPFDEKRIAKLILESVGISSTAYEFKEIDNMLEEMSKDLNKERFFLVLDDVCNENHRKWEDLEKNFKCSLPGSTILIRTRNERVAIVMGCNPESINKVNFLPEKEWSIISQIALVHYDLQKLESMGTEIANRCKYFPLAPTIVERLLTFKKYEKEWLRVLEKEEWANKYNLDPLKLSYYNLSLSLKQCFSYCAIFPEDYKIERRRLISMWMAQGYLMGKEEEEEGWPEEYRFQRRRLIEGWMDKGYVERKEGEEDLEIVGETYFDNLIALSFLQISSDDDDYCILHEMVYHLAQIVTQDECLIIEVLKDTKFNRNILLENVNAHHLILVIGKNAPFPINIYYPPKLRTLIIQFFEYESSLTVGAVKNIFDHLTSLRTLDLSRCGIIEVPSSINKLTHLRWLDLSENKNLEKLPETLCECYTLQTIILKWCKNLVELPQGIEKLSNLMYLEIDYCEKIEYLPKGIGKLRLLKELRDFFVRVYENGTSSIVVMKELNNLRGSLKIRGLGNVRIPEEARTAKLEKKKNITNLSLSFDRDHMQENDEELLEALEPPSNLEILNIEEFKGKTLFPSWIMKLNLLRKLSIRDCEKCEELPPLGKLSCLEELYLRDMGVKRVGVEFMGIENDKNLSTSFPNLRVLEFWVFWEWEEWTDIDEQLKEKITIMPCLQELRLRLCPNLKRLPDNLLRPTITRQLLKIKYCNDGLQQQINENVGSASNIQKKKLKKKKNVEIVECSVDNVAEDEKGGGQSWSLS